MNIFKINFMKKISNFILRFGLGIVFIWFGYLIFKNPEAWGSLIQPWAIARLPVSLDLLMKGAAIFDFVIGVWLIVGFLVWIPAFLAFAHLAITIAVTASGFDNVIIRDIGLACASLSLFFRKLSFGGKK